MAVTRDIVQAHTKPRAVMARLLNMGVREDRALAMLMAACALLFVMQLPYLARTAHLTGIEFGQSASYALFAALFMWPLIFYVLAGLVHIVAKAFKGQGTWYTARLALFWSLLVTMPVALLWGLMRGLNENAAAASLIGYIGCGVFLWVFVNSLIVSERRYD